MASKNFVNLMYRKEDPEFYLEQDPVNVVVARMEALAESVDKTAGEMGDQFRKFIKCAKYQDIEPTDYTQLSKTINTVKEKLDIKSEDYVQLSKTITMVQEQLEQLKIHLCCAQILMDPPEA